MNTQTQKLTLVVQPRKILYILGAIGIVTAILSFIGQYLILFPNSYSIHLPVQQDLIRDYAIEFDFRGKPNIAIYYNMLLLELAAFLLFITAHFKKASKDAYRSHWTALAWIVLFVSIDNMAVLHKKIVQYILDGADAAAWIKYGWLIAGIAILAALVFVFFRFWRHLEGKYGVLFLASVTMYFVGAVVKEYSLFTFTFPEQILQYGGATLLIYSLLLYMESHVSWFSVSAE